jgi:flagellar biosynthesis protein FliP
VTAWAGGEPPGGLTERELDVLQLVAQGLTNRETAQALDIAARTVEFHVSQSKSLPQGIRCNSQELKRSQKPMNSQSLNDKLAALAVAVLLILTAWGNAVAMLVVAVLGLVVGLLLFRKSITQGRAPAATVGFVLAVVIALVMLLR